MNPNREIASAQVPDVADSRKRAELRGREAEARSGIKSGVFAARMYATYLALSGLLSILSGPNWRAAGILAFWTAGLLLSAKRVEEGNRVEAIALSIILLTGLLTGLVLGQVPALIGLAIALATIIPLVNAVRGTFALAKIREEAAAVPGASQLLTDNTD